MINLKNIMITNIITNLLTSIVLMTFIYVCSAILYIYLIAMGLADTNNTDMYSNSIRAILSLITNN